MKMEYERKYKTYKQYKTPKEKEENFIREQIFKGRIDRLWDYYGRSQHEVNRYGYRRKGEV